ncbi:penicillin acylase family protein [Azospirillum sp. ST 5-10]|uniref:penicillin acylase family protein n=1 Tax=unclassified Azospirillum TaxID=2630922 RepID=UPI003F49B535
MPSLGTTWGLGRLAARVVPMALRRGPPRRATTAERLQAIPTRNLPVRAPVIIHWNDQHVPFIEAAHDDDLAVALGVVHAHLRLAQIELMRRAAQGRLAELLGPVAVDLDRTLRTLGLTSAVRAIVATMPERTFAWLTGFARGINTVIAQARELPEELALLGHRPEPWTVEDLVALGRLAGTDFTWRVWIPLLRLRARSDWPALWERMMRGNAMPVPSFAGGGGGTDALLALLAACGRHGSNSCAVAAERSASGHALIASDPHLGIMLPNTWLLAGLSGPGLNAVGLMIPGVPAVALGRNRRIAWGGTSLHAQSSELFDVTDLPPSEITERQETIGVRWGRPVTMTVRDTAYGPILTDAPLLPAAGGRRLALHWVGHRPSDEVTALLGVNRATGWEDFRSALDGFAIPAQNMVYADVDGRVGQCMAAHLPWRPPQSPADLFMPREARRHWERFATADTLPAIVDPPRGFVASANNRPERAGEVPVGYFFSPDDRVRRLRELLGRDAPVGIDDLKAAQRDVLVPSAPELRDRLLDTARAAGLDTSAGRGAFCRTLAAWDGRYDAESAGALGFELLLYHFARALHGPAGLDVYTAGWEPWAFLRDDLERTPPERLAAALGPALDRAAGEMRRHGTWGAVHRLRLAHALGAVPVIGPRYRFADVPAAGGNETVMKTAHGFAGDVHRVKLGANARHISDLGDPDANWFVLLGGQDGWLGSTTFLDQFALWQRGAYLQIPLRAETARTLFPHKTVLTP